LSDAAVKQLFGARAKRRVLGGSSVGEQDIELALSLFDLSEEPIEMVEVRHVSLNRGKPMPLLPPVISATFPSSLPSCFSLVIIARFGLVSIESLSGHLTQ